MKNHSLYLLVEDIYIDREEEIEDWENSILDSQKELKENRNSIRESVHMEEESTNQFTAPIWMPDISASSCLVCAVQFNIIVRKHHCRLCGFIVCNSCSRNSFFIPFKQGERRARVCDSCLPTLIQERMYRISVPPSLELFQLPRRRSDSNPALRGQNKTVFALQRYFGKRIAVYSGNTIVSFDRILLLLFGASKKEHCTLCLDLLHGLRSKVSIINLAPM